MKTVVRIRHASLRRLAEAIAPGAALASLPVLAWPSSLPENWAPAAAVAGDILIQNAWWVLAVACIALALDRLRLTWRVSRLEQQARRDGLTGLLHAGAFAECLRLEVQRANRYERQVSMLLLDLNEFKLLNDRYGHPAGDRALEFVAATLRSTLREPDIVARIGGDEFAVLLPETDLPQAEQVADRLRSLLATRVPGPECEIGVSVGVAAWVPDITDRALYCAADAALYADKRSHVVGRPVVPPVIPAGEGVFQAA